MARETKGGKKRQLEFIVLYRARRAKGSQRRSMTTICQDIEATFDDMNLKVEDILVRYVDAEKGAVPGVGFKSFKQFELSD